MKIPFLQRGRRKIVSKNKESFEASVRRSRDCVERIKREHRRILLSSDREYEQGLSDAVNSDAPLQSICDDAEYVTDVFEYAALAIEKIAVFHPFVEGNKRTAFSTAARILLDSGYILPDYDETIEFVRHVAMCEYSHEEIVEWLKRHSSHVLEL